MARFSATASTIQSHSRSRAEIVFEIAGRDQRLCGVGEESNGPLFGGVLDAGERGGISFGLIGKDDIEQVHRVSGVGKMGRDARTHGSGAQNRDTAKGLERHASPLLGSVSEFERPLCRRACGP